MSEYEPCPFCGDEPQVEYINGRTHCTCWNCMEGTWIRDEYDEEVDEADTCDQWEPNKYAI